MGVRDRYDYSPQAKVHREETIIKALECYDKAINLDPNFAIAIYDRANVLRLRDRDLSEKEYKKALSLDPDMVEARVNLSEIYISAFRFNEARELLLEANKHPVGKLRNNKSLVTEALKQLKKWQAILKHQKDPGAGCLGVGPLPGDVLQFCPQMSIRILISQRQAKEKIVDGGPCPPNLTTPHSR